MEATARGTARDTDAYKVQVAAVRTTDNLTALVKDFLKKSYTNDSIVPSWKTPSSMVNLLNLNHCARKC